MLKKIVFFVLVASMVACKGKPNEMTLQGLAPDGNSGEIVFLYESEKGQLLDSTRIVDGEFVLTAVVDTPTICHLSTVRHLVYFIAENEKLFVELKKDETPYVRGSKLNDELAVLLGKQNDIRKDLNSKIKSLTDEQENISEEEFNAKRDKITQDFEAANKALMSEYLPNHKNDILGKFIDYTLKMQQTVVWDSRPAMEGFDAESFEIAEVDATGVADIGVPQGGAQGAGTQAAGAIMATGLDGSGGESQYQGEYSYNSPAIGSLYENIVGTNSDKPEEDLELAKFIGKGNYTIVHIWSSFCAPCRAEVPFLADVYKKYHPKGLEIVGIGTDAKLATHIKWKEQMKITWPQIFDKNGRYPEVYGLEAIHMYIYDGQGKIVAKGTPGKDLDAFFAEVYK